MKKWKDKDGYECFIDRWNRTIINKSKLNFAKDLNYWNNIYSCEICGDLHKFDEMSTCDRCLRFCCDKDLVDVSIDDNVNFDLLCKECYEELKGSK